MTIGDGIAFASLMMLVGWYLWLVQRASFRSRTKEKTHAETE